MLVRAVASVSEQVGATSARRAKVSLIADLLRQSPPADVATVAGFLTGELARRPGLGPGALRDLPPPGRGGELAVDEVAAAFERMAAMSGPGSTSARRGALHGLMARADPAEQRLLIGLVTGELRQGAASGVMAEAIAEAAQAPLSAVRTALTLRGSLPAVAATARAEGPAGLARLGLRLGTPLSPMLARSEPNLTTGLARFAGSVGVEWKLDGVRLQAHQDGPDVSLFTRGGEDATARLPDVVAQVRALGLTRAVLDGEAIVLGADQRPEPFQVTGSRVGRHRGQPEDAAGRLTFWAFDLLHLDGEDLLGEGGGTRWRALRSAVPTTAVVPQRVLAHDDPSRREQASSFNAEALARGHEGVLLKDGDAAYLAGRRGGAWVKVKPRVTLDLVVIAAEWGHGRRTGFLSNLHLAARAPAAEEGRGAAGGPPGFVMLGKTFKGMTDEVLRWQTQHLLARALAPGTDRLVRVRPELVAEVAIDGVQRSTRYPGGVTLRFARLLRYRPEKAPAEADTITAVRALLR